MNENTYALFRQIDGGPGWTAGLHWQAELHDPDDHDERPYPVAIAWITDYPRDSPVGGPGLDYILVPDHLRRRGYATRLIAMCRIRFPGLWLTDGISHEGEALLRSLV